VTEVKRRWLAEADFVGGFFCFLNAVYQAYVAFLGGWINTVAIVAAALSLACALLSLLGTLARGRVADAAHGVLLPTFAVTFLATLAAGIIAAAMDWMVALPVGWFLGPMLLAFGSVTIFISIAAQPD